MADPLFDAGYTPFTPAFGTLSAPSLDRAAQAFLDIFQKLEEAKRKKMQEAAQVAAVNAPGVQSLFGMLAPTPSAPIGGLSDAPIGLEALLAAQRTAPGLNLQAGSPPSTASGAVPPGAFPGLGGGAPPPPPPPPAPPSMRGASQMPPSAPSLPPAPFRVSSPEEAKVLLGLAPSAFNLASTRESQTTRRDVTRAQQEYRGRALDQRTMSKMLDILQRQADNRAQFSEIMARARMGGGGSGIPLEYRRLKDLYSGTSANLRAVQRNIEDLVKYDGPPEEIAALKAAAVILQRDHDELLEALKRYNVPPEMPKEPSSAGVSPEQRRELEGLSLPELEARVARLKGAKK